MTLIAHMEADLKQTARNLHNEFKQKFSEEEVALIEKNLKAIHSELQDVVEKGADHGVHGQEMALAWSLLSEKDAIKKLEPEREGKVLSDGSILGTGKYQVLDPGWITAFVEWLRYYDDQLPFPENPQTLQVENNCTMAVVGDWGTGFYKENSPAENVARAVLEAGHDYTIHLGDVYYAGSPDEEKRFFVDVWPVGTRGNFTTNSNHEMYTGGRGIFQVALQDNMPFAAQKGTSYFALQNDYWTMITLDTGYFADKRNMYLDGQINDSQLLFLVNTLKNSGDRRIILFSHHEGLDLEGKEQKPLMKTILGALATVGKEAVWYWGHAHNCVVYRPVAGITGRCTGHGAIPYGDAYILKGQENVVWYETESAGDPDLPMRVLNGYMRLTLEGSSLIEEFVGENGEVRWSNRL